MANAQFRLRSVDILHKTCYEQLSVSLCILSTQGLGGYSKRVTANPSASSKFAKQLKDS